MAGMGGPTSRFCHETVKQQISGEAVKCWSGDAGKRRNKRPTPNTEGRKRTGSGEYGAWSMEPRKRLRLTRQVVLSLCERGRRSARRRRILPGRAGREGIR